MESCERAEAFAIHLETVQWAKPPLNDLSTDEDPLNDLPTCSGDITEGELL